MPLQTYTYNRIEYFVDYALKQFRTNVPFPKAITFIEFGDELGDRILCKMIRENVVDWSKLHL
jgi:hypothetical protein